MTNSSSVLLQKLDSTQQAGAWEGEGKFRGGSRVRRVSPPAEMASDVSVQDLLKQSHDSYKVLGEVAQKQERRKNLTSGS